jgi:hypothetical protein
MQFQALADTLKLGRPEHCKEYPISVKADNLQVVPMTFTLSDRTTGPLLLIHAPEKDAGSGSQQNQVGGKKRKTNESLTCLAGPFVAPIQDRLGLGYHMCTSQHVEEVHTMCWERRVLDKVGAGTYQKKAR